MFMVIFVLHDPSLLKDVLEAWDKTGVCGITILPSTGLKRLRSNDLLRDDIPLILGLDDLFKQEEHMNQTLFSVVDDDAMVDKIIEVTKPIVGDLNLPDTGILIVVPVARVIGLDRKNTKN
jgi:nitrogen regulatory protein P-II 1